MNRDKSIPTIINGPEVISSSLDKAELFGYIFASNSTLDDSNSPLLRCSVAPLLDNPSRTDYLFSDFKISIKEVSRLVHDLESTKATGMDQVPVVVLKNLSSEISQMSLCEGKMFPSSWKVSSVCPVLKHSGECSSQSQYRSISLLSVISKIFESILNRHILNHLSKNNLLANLVGLLTADVLTVISRRISEALDFTYDDSAIALDISKAFDQVWHKGLLDKLSSYGISGRVQSIIKFF